MSQSPQTPPHVTTSQTSAGPPDPTGRQEQVARLFAIIEAQFGARLDEAGRARVRERLGQQVDNSERLSAAAAKLANGDEPDFVFSPYREA